MIRKKESLHILTLDQPNNRLLYKTKKIVTDKFVKIITNDEIIEGYGFESDQDLQNYTIFNITYTTTVEDTE